MSSFEPSFIASIASKIVEMIKESDEEYFPKVYIYLYIFIFFSEFKIIPSIKVSTIQESWNVSCIF